MPSQIPSYTDYDVERENIARQQQYAQLLQQQAMETGPQGRMVGDRFVPPAWTQQLAQALKGPMAMYAQEQATEKASQLAKDYQTGAMDTMKRGMEAQYGKPALTTSPGDFDESGAAIPQRTIPGVAGDPAAAAAIYMGHPATQGMAMQTMQDVRRNQLLAQLLRGGQGGTTPSVGGNSLMPGESGGIPSGALGMDPRVATLVLSGDPALMKLGEMMAPTNDQKNWGAMGIDPRTLGPLEIAERRKKGILELQPGTTALDLSNGQERFQPKVGEGIALNGGVASQVPGYASAAAGIAGATKGAEQNATIFHGPVNGMENVPYRGSDVPALTGAVPNMPGAAGFKGDPNKIALQILNDPKIPAADKVAALSQLHAQQNAPVFGQDQAAQAYANARAKTAAENAASLNEAAASMPQLSKTVDQLKDMSGKMTYTLAGQGRDWVARQAGIATPGAVAREQYVQTVRDVLFPQLRQTFGAQFTVKEGEALIATLGDANKTPEERNAALDSFIDQKMQHLETLQRQAGVRPNQPASAPVTSTPSGVRKFNPATGKIE